MALYSIWSKPFIRRSGPIRFTTLAMAVGTAVLIMFSLLIGSFTPVEAFGPPQWPGVFYLGAFGSALTFYLWAFTLERTTPPPTGMPHLVNIAVATCSFCPHHTISRTKSIALSATSSADSKDP